MKKGTGWFWDSVKSAETAKRNAYEEVRSAPVRKLPLWLRRLDQVKAELFLKT
jgi:hypothetical protein